MGIFGRVKSIAKADVNDYLDRLEQPASMVKQHLRDLEEQIGKAQQAYANQLVAERRLGVLISDVEQTIAKRSRQAELAVEHGEESIAKLAIQERLLLEQTQKEYREQQAYVAAQTAALTEELKKLKETYSTLQHRLHILTVRAHTAQTLQEVNRTMQSFDTGKVLNGLGRLENQVWKAEAQVQAGRHVNQIFQGSAPQPSELLLQDRVQEELAKLKEVRKRAE
jgi:phage shock protein A